MAPTMSRLGYAQLAAFVAGFSTMAVEMAGSRTLAPCFGTSLPVWTNLIGLFMAALAAGAYLGGSAAARSQITSVGLLLAGAGIYVAGLPFMGSPILEALGGRPEMGVAGGSFLAILVLYAPPVLVLGMITPIAIALSTRDPERAGRVAGRIYALTTLGSLIGTLAPSLLTLPLFGVRRSMLLYAGVLMLTGILAFLSRESPGSSSPPATVSP